jgi:hypothetical protein
MLLLHLTHSVAGARREFHIDIRARLNELLNTHMHSYPAIIDAEEMIAMGS